jgi:inward rectifier potassium channel
MFAGLYLLDPTGIANARPGSFLDAFFFSTETLATVGYGVMSPATTYTHFVATAEIICGLAFTAIMTGLLFVRFSRPKAKIAYAEHAVIAAHNGCPTLMIRIGNARQSLLTDARVRLTALMRETTSEGNAFRYTRELPLVRAENPLFALTWTLMHRIDAHSPLHGFTTQDLENMAVRLFLTVEARDHALAAEVHDLKDYSHANILFDTRYVDAVTTDAEGHTLADLNRISMVEPDRVDAKP